MPNQVQIHQLVVGTPFMHVGDEGTKDIQPERVFRLIAIRASTAIVENAVGVRSSMSKKTTVVALAAEQWSKVARPSVAAPIAAADVRPQSGAEKATG